MTQDPPLFETERKPVIQRDLCAGEVKLHAHIERHTAQSRIIPGFVAKAMKHGDADAARAVPEAIVLMPNGKSTANGGGRSREGAGGGPLPGSSIQMCLRRGWFAAAPVGAVQRAPRPFRFCVASCGRTDSWVTASFSTGALSEKRCRVGSNRDRNRLWSVLRRKTCRFGGTSGLGIFGKRNMRSPVE